VAVSIRRPALARLLRAPTAGPGGRAPRTNRSHRRQLAGQQSAAGSVRHPGVFWDRWPRQLPRIFQFAAAV